MKIDTYFDPFDNLLLSLELIYINSNLCKLKTRLNMSEKKLPLYSRHLSFDAIKISNKSITMVLDEIRLMRETRMLKDDDVKQILRGTPRPFGKRTRFVVGGMSLVQQPPLRRGEGMLLGLQYGLVGHMVSVYCCPDGHYIYHDSEDAPPHPAFLEYCARNKVPTSKVKMVSVQLQDRMFNTCAYHSFTFLDFVTRCRDTSVYSIIMKFRRHMRARPDVKAVLTVEHILREFKNSVNISLLGSFPAGSVLA